jgi:polygalacturonase
MATENTPRREFLRFAGTGLAVAALAQAAPDSSGMYDVRNHGAKGDGKALDTDAINKTIEAAAAAGGGTVVFPAGEYLSYSIRLKSNIALHLEHGATLIAADPTPAGGFDMAEPDEWDMYQDFGHSHFHNSLIWGEGITNVAITGTGRIWGRSLSKGMELPERAAAGFLDSAWRAFRHSGNRHRQHDDRQSEDRHQSRRHGYRRVPQRADLELLRQFAVG